MNTTFEGAEAKDTAIYFNVLGSDGTLRVTVPEGTEGATRRDYETKDGAKGTKFEKVYKKVTGRITDVSFYDGDYGRNLIIELTNDAEQVAKVSLNTQSNFAEDTMGKLPAVDFTQPVTFAPYSFTDNHGKNKRGMTIFQGGTEKENKVESFFKAWDDEKKTFVYKNNFPAPKGDVSKYTSDKWKIYFAEARVFLGEYIEEHIVPKFSDKKDAPVNPDAVTF